MQSYTELKVAWEMFQKGPESLLDPEKDQVRKLTRQQMDMERRILSSREAAGVVVCPSTLSKRLDEVRRRYDKNDEYQADLQRIGLTENGLVEAVSRDLHVEAVLEKIAARAAPVSEVEAEIFYRLRPQSFERPEARRLRHVLITFGNAREKSAARLILDKLRRTLESTEDFAAAALRHSHCPTALQGGNLGIIRRGQLYDELEPAAFALKAQGLSDIVESPAGLHLLRCDEIFEGGQMEFTQVQDRIKEKLTDQRRRQAQRDWIATLPR